MQDPSIPRTDEDRQALLTRARASIEAARQLLRESGVSSQTCLESLRRGEGEQSAQRVQQEVRDTLQAIDDQVRRDSVHASAVHSVSRYVAQRDIV